MIVHEGLFAEKILLIAVLGCSLVRWCGLCGGEVARQARCLQRRHLRMWRGRGTFSEGGSTGEPNSILGYHALVFTEARVTVSADRHRDSHIVDPDTTPHPRTIYLRIHADATICPASR